jgi:hypothetical protein
MQNIWRQWYCPLKFQHQPIDFQACWRALGERQFFWTLPNSRWGWNKFLIMMSNIDSLSCRGLLHCFYRPPIKGWTAYDYLRNEIY